MSECAPTELFFVCCFLLFFGCPKACVNYIFFFHLLFFEIYVLCPITHSKIITKSHNYELEIIKLFRENVLRER